MSSIGRKTSSVDLNVTVGTISFWSDQNTIILARRSDTLVNLARNLTSNNYIHIAVCCCLADKFRYASNQQQACRRPVPSSESVQRYQRPPCGPGRPSCWPRCWLWRWPRSGSSSARARRCPPGCSSRRLRRWSAAPPAAPSCPNVRRCSGPTAVGWQKTTAAAVTRW